MDLSSWIVACGDLAGAPRAGARRAGRVPPRAGLGRAVRAAVLVAAVALSASAAGQQAQRRFVVVNGQRLTDLQVMQIEALYCSPIADGRFWYDVESGLWGYEGNPQPQGRFVYRCGQQQRQRSLSERGLLYSTGEILRGRP